MMNDPLTPEAKPRGFRKFVKLRRWHAVAITVVAAVILFLSINPLNESGMITRAKSATALAQATSLETAINSFFSEYSELPHVSGQLTSDGAEGRKFLEILTGMEPKSGTIQNLRGIKFFTVKEAKNRKGGMVYDSSGKFPEGLFDPWGNPYTIVLNTDFGRELHFKIGDKLYDVKDRNVVIVSPGADGRLDTTDDVRTW